jgi:hypothetical protein
MLSSFPVARAQTTTAASRACPREIVRRRQTTPQRRSRPASSLLRKKFLEKGNQLFAKDPAAGISEYQRAIKAFSDFYEAYYAMGIAELNQEHHAEAEGLSAKPSRRAKVATRRLYLAAG